MNATICCPDNITCVIKYDFFAREVLGKAKEMVIGSIISGIFITVTILSLINIKNIIKVRKIRSIKKMLFINILCTITTLCKIFTSILFIEKDFFQFYVILLPPVKFK